MGESPLSSTQFGADPGAASAVPQGIRAQPREGEDTGVVALQSKNQTTYGRTTAWRVPNGKAPVPHSKETSGSYLNFD